MKGPKEEAKDITRAAGVVGGATMASRVLGLVRDMTIAFAFGAGASADAFFVAFRIPNLFRRLVAEGAVTVSFIPVFTERLAKGSFREARHIAHVAMTLLAAVLFLVSLLGVLFSPWLVRLFAPGFYALPEKFGLTVALTRVLFPYIFFIGFVALAMGILNSLRHFAAPAVAPLLLNISMITGALCLAPFFDPPVFGLAVGVLIGGALQLALQIPFLIKKGITIRFAFEPGNEAVRRIATLMIPATFGAAVYQINVFVNTLLASLLPEGSVSYLYYADRLVQLPLGVFAIALATAALPSMSRLAGEGKVEELIDLLSYAVRLTLFLAVPSAVGLILLRVPIFEVLFQRGSFDATTTAMTARALLYYALGLWAFSCIRVVVQFFYSLQDFRTPVKVSVLAAVANVVLGLLLMGPMRHAGLALALSISSTMNLGILVFIIRRRYGRIDGRRIASSAAKTIVASTAMAAMILAVGHVLPWDPAAGTPERVGLLALNIAAGIAAFFIACKLLRSEEVGTVVGMIKRRNKRDA